MPISKQFILAGDAIFTIACPDGTHHTYRVQHVPANGQWPEAWFVKLFTGSDNNDPRAYTYLGKLNTYTGQVQHTAKSCRPADHIIFRLLNRVLARVWCDDHAAYQQHGYETHHEGRCGKCGRRLTVPESVEEGIGPECRKIMGMVPLSRVTKADPTSAPQRHSDADEAVMRRMVQDAERREHERAYTEKMNRDEMLYTAAKHRLTVQQRTHSNDAIGARTYGPGGGVMTSRGQYTGD